MRGLFFLLMLPLSVAGQSFEQYFTPHSLRIDYFRGGNATEQHLSLDKMIRQDSWAGSHNNLADTFMFGEYRIELFAENSDKPLFAKGFSTLFMEWQTTAEAKGLERSFRESVVIPFPREKMKLHFKSRTEGENWELDWVLDIDPEDPNIILEQRMSYPVADLMINGPDNQCLDLAILAEGYRSDQMDKFLDDARRFADYLFNTRPYSEMKNKINIRAVLANSKDEGTDFPHQGEWKRTAMNSRFFTFGSERYLTTDDYHAVMDVAANVPWDQVLILVNTAKYGGGGIYNHYLVCTADHPSSDFVFTHELGHSFAGLGDEYYSSSTAYEDFYDLSVEPWEPNITTLVDFDSKWKDMVEEGTPVPTPVSSGYDEKVGVFEGAGYVEKGVYRPYLDCSMKSAKFDNFCPVCQRAIRRMMEWRTGVGISDF